MTTAVSCTVHLTDEARGLLQVIAGSDKRIASRLADLMDDLSSSPDQKGRPLGGELTGLNSLHAIGNRFRIIYEIGPGPAKVSIISVGIREAGSRRDIYELTKKIRAKRKN